MEKHIISIPKKGFPQNQKLLHVKLVFLHVWFPAFGKTPDFTLNFYRISTFGKISKKERRGFLMTKLTCKMFKTDETLDPLTSYKLYLELNENGWKHTVAYSRAALRWWMSATITVLNIVFKNIKVGKHTCWNPAFSNQTLLSNIQIEFVKCVEHGFQF